MIVDPLQSSVLLSFLVSFPEMSTFQLIGTNLKLRSVEVKLRSSSLDGRDVPATSSVS